MDYHKPIITLEPYDRTVEQENKQLKIDIAVFKEREVTLQSEIKLKDKLLDEKKLQIHQLQEEFLRLRAISRPSVSSVP